MINDFKGISDNNFKPPEPTPIPPPKVVESKPPQPVKPPPKKPLFVKPLTQNEQLVQEISSALDRAKAKNLLLEGKIQLLESESQKYQATGLHVTLEILDKQQDFYLRKDSDYADILKSLLDSLLSYGVLTNYNIEPICGPQEEDQ